MKLFLIVNGDIGHRYDYYTEAVVAAPNEDEARLIHPDEDIGADWWLKDDNTGFSGPIYTWCKPEEVAVTFIGTTDVYAEPTVISSAFYGV